MSLLLCITSCDKSDDLETTFGTEPPIIDETPTEPNSVIVYSDVEPDFTSEKINDSVNLDLNNDQIVDFIVRSGSQEDWESLGIASNPNSENGIISVAPWYIYSVPLDSGKEIFKLAGYRNGEYYETGSIFSIGECSGEEFDCLYEWTDKEGMYLGLKFNKNGQTHYGWAQINIVSVTQWTIKDYAYNATANKSIKAGQME